MTNAGSTPHGIEIQELSGPPIVREPETPPCVMVIFGATGDLTRRKLVPALYNLALDGALPEPTAIVGLSADDVGRDALRADLRESTAKFSRRQPLDADAWERFAGRLDFVRGDFEDDEAYAALGRKLADLERERGTHGNRIFYLATPPKFFPVIVRHLCRAGLVSRPAGAEEAWSRVVIEKPFGRDLTSARELNRLLSECLDESQTFRIDHYLGKETVQNILVLRFGNLVLEPLWNRKYVDHIEITAAESIGVEHRGSFYDSTGVVRDIFQSHLLQVLALCTMEAPVSFAADDVRDQKVQILRSLHPIAASEVRRRVVVGQYRGYREEEGVAADSRTPTYAAMKVLIDSWRWQGVPFYLRAGKRLAKRVTEVAVHFQSIPLCLFPEKETPRALHPNVLVVRIQPHEGISLRFVAKVPGEHLSVGNIFMNMSYADAFGKPLSEAYERLLVDCMRGDATLFARRDGIEHAWSFVTPILQALEADPRRPVCVYEPGVAGPAEADELLARDGHRWREL